MALAVPWTRCLSITSLPDLLRHLVQSRKSCFARLPKTHDVFSTEIHKVLFSKRGAGFSDVGGGALWIDPEITYDVEN